MHKLSPQKVIVGLSGGVDSSVTALLLQQQGYTIEGLFMKNWEEDDTDSYCPAAQDAADAQAVCDKLGIRLHTVNFAAAYWDRVFSHFLAEYQAGRTPNPDILCNTEIKFKAFLDYALELGASSIATGHYARHLRRDDQSYLLTGADRQKDQSYFLHGLNQYQLSHSLFPLGELDKTTVRQLAFDAGFINHNKKDSTGICFIGERRFKDFLSHYLPSRPGNMETPDKQVIGRHDGLMYYTLGQRKGLGIGGQEEGEESPWYVLAKDLARNVLIVGQGHDHPLLFQPSLQCKQIHWISPEPPVFPLICQAKTRYRQASQDCVVTPLSAGQLQVDFTVAQRAITPGQSVVFYQGEVCLGGGVIS